MKYHCLFILLFDCCNLSFHLCQSMTTAIKKINWIGFSLLLMFKQHENTNYKHPITSIKSQHKRYKYIFLCRSQTLLLWERVRTNIITRTICMTSITCTRQYFTYGFQRWNLTHKFVLETATLQDGIEWSVLFDMQSTKVMWLDLNVN